MAAGICQARLSPSQTSESGCYMRSRNSTILSRLILARQLPSDVRERHPFRSADHNAAWLHEIEARLELDDTRTLADFESRSAYSRTAQQKQYRRLYGAIRNQSTDSMSHSR